MAVVTGGALGIGAAIVRAGAREGARVWALDVDEESGRKLAATAGDAVRFRRVDVTDEAAIARVTDEIVAESGAIDILVNCASRDSNADATTMTSEAWDALMALDLRAPWLMSRAVLPGMIARGGGAIVNIGSLHAIMTAEGAFPYGAAKAGLAGLTRSLALDMGPHGVRVNTVTPGWVLSERVAASFDGDDARRRAVEQTQPLRRMGTPDEIASVVVFVASDEASFVTGANWLVDGGLGARFA
ncbi:SDR family oxidoreductase [Galbitalea sp. SE-J8]|uniref:SDR family NAD(P)-dependent oxidoreductase n=1 Tax=Galbitalea sp. SE-J8 TaxID=3054952 RepID=UPI00259CEC1A|nr:SDR family oxidoreductase [Galbitalea sp. SE-J8]MDM4761993.1 SDR family oxidoreductase [Galbitalea sp. SE-J8]